MNPIRVALIGNPNSGKTTLFNALTGARQKVGNWPGVTVERKVGFFDAGSEKIELVDLPGTYNLSLSSEKIGIDEKIAVDYMLSRQADLILNIIDASNLERNLFLTTQLVELGLPMVMILNMIDLAEKKGIVIDLDKFAKEFKCPVVAIAASKKIGLSPLKKIIVNTAHAEHEQKIVFHYPDSVEKAITSISDALIKNNCVEARYFAIHLLENDRFALQQATDEIKEQNSEWQKKIEDELHDDPDIILADQRYGFINRVIKNVVNKKTTHGATITELIDCVVLNRFLGIPIFLAVMYCMFLFAINVGGAFQDFFDIGSSAIFVDGLAHLLQSLHFPNWLVALLSAGVGKGINTTITFIPVIGGMFLFLSVLEASGYMTRAAFVVDRLMQVIGLPGKSFVPLIVGFGCNVPAILAARTLENQRDRILTIMMSPFMSCGARLAIYAIFTAAFFPKGGQNIVFALYLIGILMAVLTGFILRKTVLRGESSALVMELPAYHVPTLKNIALQTWHRLNKFLFKAGKMIVPVCVLIGTLNAVTIDGRVDLGGSDDKSILAVIGKTITPVFSPMGIQTNNWPATVGLLTGTLAKEVVVATLNTLYTQAAHLKNTEADTFNFKGEIREAFESIPTNLKGLMSSLGNPVVASAPEQSVTQGVYGEMYQLFGGQAAAFAYLLFVLLYFPCVSATAAVLRELNRGWTIFSMTWTTGLAYGVATLFYQSATLLDHPVSSMIWVASMISLFFCAVLGMRYYAQHTPTIKINFFNKGGYKHDSQ